MLIYLIWEWCNRLLPITFCILLLKTSTNIRTINCPFSMTCNFLCSYPSKIFKLILLFQPHDDVRQVSLKVTARVQNPEVDRDASLFLFSAIFVADHRVLCWFSYHCHRATSFCLYSPSIEGVKLKLNYSLALHQVLLEGVSWKHPNCRPVAKMKKQSSALHILVGK